MAFVLVDKSEKGYGVLDTRDLIVEYFSSSIIKDAVVTRSIPIRGLKFEGGHLKYKLCKKPLLRFGDLLDNSYFDRDEAICIIEGKVYKSSCHQDCYEDYLNEKGTSLKVTEGIDLGTDIGFEEACEVTHGKFYTCEMYGWDIYKDYNNQGYLIAHFESNFIDCFDWAKSYASANDFILGTYKDGTNRIYEAWVEYEDFNN